MNLNDFLSPNVLVETQSVLKQVYAFLNEDFEWEPQPECRGVKGINSNTGAGMRDAKANKEKKQGGALQDAWEKLVNKVANSSLTGEGRQKAMMLLQKLLQAAKANGVTLEPGNLPEPYVNALKMRRAFENVNEAYETTIQIADPNAAFALKKARAKYAYSKSDLEAFVKMVHDDYNTSTKKIDALERDKKLSDTKISNLERSSDHYKQRIQDLTKDVKDLQQKVNRLR